MTPTPKLRFVERVINISTSADGLVSNGTKVRILQQWWEPTEWNAEGEWRDVPLEAE